MATAATPRAQKRRPRSLVVWVIGGSRAFGRIRSVSPPCVEPGDRSKGEKTKSHKKVKRVDEIISNFSKGPHLICDFFLDARWRIQSLVHGIRVVIGRDRDIGLNIHERRIEAPVYSFLIRVSPPPPPLNAGKTRLPLIVVLIQHMSAKKSKKNSSPSFHCHFLA